jgi:hypothetical protein
LNEDKPAIDAKPPPLSPFPSPRGIACHSCRTFIDSAFAFCPHCGKRQNAGDAWYYHPAWILLLGFVVIGPFALPLAWKSRRMGPTGKVLTTVAILIYTAFCVYSVYKIVLFELEYFGQFDDLYR